MKFQENVSLSKHGHYRIGGPARFFVVAKTATEVKEALREAKERKLKVFILGAGTNLLIDDAGFDGLVLKINIHGLKFNGKKLIAGAGEMMHDVLEFAVKKKMVGLSWAGGLPGTVGGAVRGNAGCFGGETKDNVFSVRTINTKTLKEKVWPAKQCKFGYRNSIFKQKGGQEIILETTFVMKPGDVKAIRAEMADHIRYRQERQPLEYPNIGSIFKNVPLAKIAKAKHKLFAGTVKTDPFPVVPSAHLISEAGLKGVAYGGAMISPKHPNFIVNVLQAKASDVQALISLVRTEVKKKFGIELEPEVIEL